MLKFLKWYSPILVSLAVGICFIEWVSSDFEDYVSFWAAALYTPVVVYLWLLVGKK